MSLFKSKPLAEQSNLTKCVGWACRGQPRLLVFSSFFIKKKDQEEIGKV